MSRRLAEQKIRGFQLLVNPTNDAFGITLEETNGDHDNTCVVARVDDVRTRSVLASVMDAEVVEKVTYDLPRLIVGLIMATSIKHVVFFGPLNKNMERVCRGQIS